jgi:hypothetical protein
MLRLNPARVWLSEGRARQYPRACYRAGSLETGMRRSDRPTALDVGQPGRVTRCRPVLCSMCSVPTAGSWLQAHHVRHCITSVVTYTIRTPKLQLDSVAELALWGRDCGAVMVPIVINASSSSECRKSRGISDGLLCWPLPGKHVEAHGVDIAWCAERWLLAQRGISVVVEEPACPL